MSFLRISFEFCPWSTLSNKLVNFRTETHQVILPTLDLIRIKKVMIFFDESFNFLQVIIKEWFEFFFFHSFREFAQLLAHFEQTSALRASTFGY